MSWNFIGFMAVGFINAGNCGPFALAAANANSKLCSGVRLAGGIVNVHGAQ